MQAEGSNLAKDLLRNGIKEYLEVPEDSKVISIADLGCSVGPNTFSCTSNIIEAAKENPNLIKIQEKKRSWISSFLQWSHP